MQCILTVAANKLNEKQIVVKCWTTIQLYAQTNIHGQSKMTKDGIPRGTAHPMVLMISPTCIMISPTVLSIPHSTQDNPHGTHDIPPTVLKISPTFIMISSHGTEHPHGTQDIPHMHHDIPTVLDTPHGTENLHGTEHTLYRVILLRSDVELTTQAENDTVEQFRHFM